MNIKGESYRLPEKLKAGLVKSKTAPEGGADHNDRLGALGTTISGQADREVGSLINHVHQEGHFR
jgi:hypothetical protein